MHRSPQQLCEVRSCVVPVRMEPRRAPPDRDTGSGPAVTLYGEFTAIGNRKVRYGVSLTEKELIIQRLSSAPVPPRGKVLLSLRDCVGSRAHRGEDNSDPAAYFTAYFYPLRKRWMSSGTSRQRVEQGFRLGALKDLRYNLEEAEKWARAVRERSARQQCRRDGEVMSEPPRRRMMLLVNPQSGRGQALSLYNSHIQRMLHEADVAHTLVITERQNHARELVRDSMNLAQWDALVIMSGDGLLFEVINGLMERPDWEEAIRMPLAILPGGSGNALAASVHHYSGSTPVSSEELLTSCGFLLCKGLVSRMDLVSIQLASGSQVFSFLSLAWGFVADVDIESEKYRHVGAARFTVGTLVRLASLRVYRGRLAYLPASLDVREDQPSAQTPSLLPASKMYSYSNDNCCPIPEQNSCHSNNSVKVTRRENGLHRNGPQSRPGPQDSLLPPLHQPVPSNWVTVPERDFVLMLAMYQSHLAEDLFAAPDSTVNDGLIHLIYIKAGISRAALLKLFLAMEKGAHLTANCQHLVHAKVRALRLEPHSPKGIITVDGEVVEYGPVQAEVHRGLARLITG